MSLEQLDALRSHLWVSRKIEQVKEGETVNDTTENALREHEKLVTAKSDTKPAETTSVLTIQQKRTLEHMSCAIQKDFASFEDLHQKPVSADIKGKNDEATVILAIITVIKAKVKEEIREKNPESPETITSNFRGSEELMKIMAHEENLRNMLKEQILEIAFRLRKEGVIVEPALEWDGSLGPEETVVINRLGFLLNAYTVQCWYWEVSAPTPHHTSKYNLHIEYVYI
jgi:hypothetical protein